MSSRPIYSLTLLISIICWPKVCWTLQVPSLQRSSRCSNISPNPKPIRELTFLLSYDNDNDDNGNAQASQKAVDVSDLGLTVEDLEAPLPSELLEIIETSGYQSTSRVPTVEDDGCGWTENGNTLDVTLTIPGLRGQPAACLAVDFSTTTATITAFGRPVWSCIFKGIIDPDTAFFLAEDGPNMIPVVQLNIEKAPASPRWGGFIEQIGEDSIL